MRLKKNSSPKTPEKAFSLALRFLTIRIRSIHEIEEYLKKKGFPKKIYAQTVERLKNLKYLNDEEFGRTWISSRQKHKGKSTFVLRMELKSKGLDENLIEKLIEVSQDDVVTARNLFERKKRQFEKYEGAEYIQKASQFLQRRGFSWSIIKKVINR